MTSSYHKYDVLVVKFPFTHLRGSKARPVVVISNDFYHHNSRNDLIVMALSSQTRNKLKFEPGITKWKEAGLLKRTILKSAIASISAELVLNKLGSLQPGDMSNLDRLLESILMS